MGYRNRPGFTLIELLVVIAIIAVLAGILFPVFAAARGKARSTRCCANLQQIGQAMRMYMDDYDGLFPWACDQSDRLCPSIWDNLPYWQAWIPYMPYFHEVLDPYIKSRELWHCPADSGYDELDDARLPINGRPTGFAAFGTSYFYRTELAFRLATQESLRDPVALNVVMDSSGMWHGGRSFEDGRLNVLFGDLHVKSLHRQAFQECWEQSVY